MMKAERLVLSACVALLCGMANAGATGFRPHPNPLRHLTNAVERTRSGGPARLRVAMALPEQYDLRNVEGESHLSPIRDQGSYGTCWTFATMACLEWAIRRDEGIDSDLSENNLANMHGFLWGYGYGGNNEMALAAILREECPVSEALDPYPHPGASVRERGVRVPRKVVFVPVRSSVSDPAQLESDLHEIKQAVFDYGPLATSYAHYDAFCNGSSYYCSDPSNSNHAVAIVGWNDNYPASNFKVRPPGNGAFIIRNSWGTGVFDSGYMYISYYDATLGVEDVQVAYASLSDGSDYGRVYQYDPQGYVGTSGFSGFTEVNVANIFTARTNETLSAFGFYALEPGISYEASIVRNAHFDGDQLTGDWTLVKGGACENAGYEVIPFDTEVAVAGGEQFAIAVKIEAADVGGIVPMTHNMMQYVNGVQARAGLCIMRPDSRYYWNDMSSNGRYFCCKVYPAAQVPATATTSTETAVPYGWLNNYVDQQAEADYFMRYYLGCYNALAEHVAPNRMPVETSFAKGLDPDNAAETNLIATIGFDAAGRPVVGVEPKNIALWDYAVLGSSNLLDWHVKTDADRFFKVSVQPRQ